MLTTFHFNIWTVITQGLDALHNLIGHDFDAIPCFLGGGNDLIGRQTKAPVASVTQFQNVRVENAFCVVVVIAGHASSKIFI